ncbi:unnamed protein product [Debaryomyces tyrocola]|nr:unnamed protein product [Debaryomyces tyrocola]
MISPKHNYVEEDLGALDFNGKLLRPCDGCALRKVRCNRQKPCSQCIKHNVSCTSNRIKKKCGPKQIHKKTKETIQRLNLENGVVEPGILVTAAKISDTKLFTVDKLLPYLQIYQTWYYGVWPVLSIAHLVAKMVQDEGKEQPELNTEVDTAYVLACSVCADIATQLTFLSDTLHVRDMPTGIEAKDFADEALRIRSRINYRLNPNIDTLLSSFFLYDYYVNVKDYKSVAITYLRETLTFAQILGLHNPKTYFNQAPASVHRMKKIYYMLMITERFLCIEENIPVLLTPSIPFPALEDEEYPEILSGFTELVRIFSIPDKSFFDKLAEESSNSSNLKLFQKSLFQLSNPPTQNWIVNVQNNLQNVSISPLIPDTQKLNIILSQHWMRALGWHIANQNELLIRDSDDNHCLSPQFPLNIAKEFLTSTENLSQFAFESNGSGVCVKLLEIANALADSVSESTVYKYDTYNSYDALGAIFQLVGKFKKDILLPVDLYNKIDTIISDKAISKFPAAYITEVDDEASSRIASSNSSNENNSNDNVSEIVNNIPHTNNATNKLFSPYTQMTMGIGLAPGTILPSLSSSNLAALQLQYHQQPHNIPFHDQHQEYRNQHKQQETHHYELPFLDLDRNVMSGSNVYVKDQKIRFDSEIDFDNLYNI